MKITNGLLSISIFAILTSCGDKITTIKNIGEKTPQTQYAAEILGRHISNTKGYEIKLGIADNSNNMEKEGFHINRKGNKISIIGNDASGVIYGANKLVEFYKQNGNLNINENIIEVPEMKLRGACVGLQKTEYLPGHTVYEYPYTPENFPWFYDKDLWVRYLDMLAADNMNAVFLWNGHPFASLVKLEDYPFATEVDDATMAKNQEIFSFLTEEAAKRGIKVIQMFYNIIVSKPFAEHYGIKTQDRNRPLQRAAWFPRNNCPATPPKGSIAYRLIHGE